MHQDLTSPNRLDQSAVSSAAPSPRTLRFDINIPSGSSELQMELQMPDRIQVELQVEEQWAVVEERCRRELMLIMIGATWRDQRISRKQQRARWQQIKNSELVD